ncbi:MAG: GAF domain-containing protein [Cyanobium sp.]
MILQDDSPDNSNKPIKKLLGCLYLDKYQEDFFTNVERFTLELLARHAAISLNKNLLVADKMLSTKALEGLKNAIESIAGLDDLHKLLQEVARLAYDMCDIPVTFEEQRSRSPEWPDLIAYVAEYSDQEEMLIVKAAYPPQYVGRLNDAFKEGKRQDKVGISGLSMGLKKNNEAKTYNIPDIQIEKENQTLPAEEYITHNDRAKSQLLVPVLIRATDQKIPQKIVVITLEHTTAHAFSDYLKDVIEQFAQHVAVAYAQQRRKDKIKSDNQIVTSLHKSLEVIVREPPQTMLYKAVTQTREALQAKAVYVVPIESINSNEIKILWDKSEPSVDQSVLESKFRIVNHESDPASFEEVTTRVFQDKKESTVESDTENGFCFLFSSGEKSIGVIWILYSQYAHIPPFDVDIIRSYVIKLHFHIQTQLNLINLK